MAVAEPARALVVAGLATVSSRHPLVVAVATAAEAERLARDLVAYLGEARVEAFPAWETLPFERISPGVETMGRRMRTLWRLRNPEVAPAVVVTSVRALLQRLGPHVEDVDPGARASGSELRPRRAGGSAGGHGLPA